MGVPNTPSIGLATRETTEGMISGVGGVHLLNELKNGVHYYEFMPPVHLVYHNRPPPPPPPPEFCRSRPPASSHSLTRSACGTTLLPRSLFHPAGGTAVGAGAGAGCCCDGSKGASSGIVARGGALWCVCASMWPS